MQVVGYDPTPDPGFYLADDGQVHRHSLAVGESLAFSLTDRHCAGTIRGDHHRPCAEAAAPFCAAHDDTWICARCRGTCLKDEMDCHVDHDIYLAAFAPRTFKVGVTRSGRLQERLTEQGADRGARIHQVQNGRIAREREAAIANEIPDRVPTPVKVRGLTRSLDTDAWEALLDQHGVDKRVTPEYQLAIDQSPISETIVRGTVRGVKGRLLCLRWNGSTYATDLRDLLGYHVVSEDRPRQVQTGLDAFS